jgi:putative transposase
MHRKRSKSEVLGQNETTVETLLATSLYPRAVSEIMQKVLTTNSRLFAYSTMTLYEGKYRMESARLRDWDYRSRGWYFVTICSRNKVCIFGQVVRAEVQLSRPGQIANQDLRSLYQHYQDIQVESHVVMPNHVHAIIMIDGDHYFSPAPKNAFEPKPAGAFVSPQAGSLSAIIRSYKAGVTGKAHEIGFRHPIWQTRFHDHLLRGDSVISAVREYIRNNPAKWGEDKENSMTVVGTSRSPQFSSW